jgi:hypothetical protein
MYGEFVGYHTFIGDKMGAVSYGASISLLFDQTWKHPIWWVFGVVDGALSVFHIIL